MKYLLTALVSYACTYYLTGLLIQGRLADIAEGLRHRPDAPRPGEYLRKVERYARRSRRQYSLAVGSVLAVVGCLLLYWLG
ncbi:hypothetical protein QEM13_000179 [Pseudomonas putida]|uniref:hypothetical protein n=1 Tax=Pseudomonas sp. p1(2021b) TaxID=2874628 RepID=UPI001CCDFCC7|nr:hypothetical protein [Pseudomonas sp. p1(2021b)]EKT4520987.1 hypothetical protein [Pseudomonas putida]UBM23268.1 hypothetical protein K8374_12705 [Pseudomonas sp. p1(2021b)]